MKLRFEGQAFWKQVAQGNDVHDFKMKWEELKVSLSLPSACVYYIYIYIYMCVYICIYIYGYTI